VKILIGTLAHSIGLKGGSYESPSASLVVSAAKLVKTGQVVSLAHAARPETHGESESKGDITGNTVNGVGRSYMRHHFEALIRRSPPRLQCLAAAGTLQQGL